LSTYITAADTAYDQTVAEDYFAAMSRVEQRLEIVPAPIKEPETEYEVV
jgi:hypothetical protein